MSGLGIVTALGAEARPLGRSRPVGSALGMLVDGTKVAVSGIGHSAAEQAAHRLIESGVSALVSFGMAGGLDPALVAGALVLPREVISVDGTRFPTVPAWRDRLAAAMSADQAVCAGVLLSSRGPISAPVEKAVAFRTTAAVAVDMESASVAEVAARQRVPFIAVRAIVDTAEDSLAPLLTAAVIASGRIAGRDVLGALLRAPAEWSSMLRLVRRYRVAGRTLLAVARSGALAPRDTDRAAALAFGK